MKMIPKPEEGDTVILNSGYITLVCVLDIEPPKISSYKGNYWLLTYRDEDDEIHEIEAKWNGRMWEDMSGPTERQIQSQMDRSIP